MSRSSEENLTIMSIGELAEYASRKNDYSNEIIELRRRNTSAQGQINFDNVSADLGKFMGLFLQDTEIGVRQINDIANDVSEYEELNTEEFIANFIANKTLSNKNIGRLLGKVATKTEMSPEESAVFTSSVIRKTMDYSSNIPILDRPKILGGFSESCRHMNTREIEAFIHSFNGTIMSHQDERNLFVAKFAEGKGLNSGADLANFVDEYVHLTEKIQENRLSIDDIKDLSKKVIRGRENNINLLERANFVSTLAERRGISKNKRDLVKLIDSSITDSMEFAEFYSNLANHFDMNSQERGQLINAVSVNATEPRTFANFINELEGNRNLERNSVILAAAINISERTSRKYLKQIQNENSLINRTMRRVIGRSRLDTLEDVIAVERRNNELSRTAAEPAAEQLTEQTHASRKQSHDRASKVVRASQKNITNADNMPRTSPQLNRSNNRGSSRRTSRGSERGGPSL